MRTASLLLSARQGPSPISLLGLTLRSLFREGPIHTWRRARSYLNTLGIARSSSELRLEQGRDCLFVSGCPGNPRRYRSENPRDALAALGLDCDIADHPLVDYEAVLPCFDVFVLHRVPWSTELERFAQNARDQGKRVLFDTDDLDFDPAFARHMSAVSAMSPLGKELYLEAMADQGKAIALADEVLVSTPALGGHIQTRFGGKKPWRLIRNAASEDLAALSSTELSRSGDETLTLGYFSGTPTHERDLQSVAPALESVLDAVPDLRLLLVGEIGLPSGLESHARRIEMLPAVPWRELPPLLRRAHLHLAPIEAGNPFAEAKSELKFFEAGLVGRPLVASARGAFRDCIRHEVNGLLCEGSEDWTRTLLECAADRSRLDELGRQARKDSLARYSMQGRVRDWVAALEPSLRTAHP